MLSWRLASVTAGNDHLARTHMYALAAGDDEIAQHATSERQESGIGCSEKQGQKNTDNPQTPK